MHESAASVRQHLFCCRSDLDKPDAHQAEEKDDDFVKAFKVANFEITASADNGRKEPTAILSPVYNIATVLL